jgi:hypothetical protein
MSIIGNTVKLHVEFTTWAGSHSDVDSGNIKIYDTVRNLLQTIPLSAINKVSAGIYESFYTVPDGYGDLSVEASGILETNPIVGRVSLGREWV